MMLHLRMAACSFAVGLLLLPQAVRAQEGTIGAARELYASAAYEDALTVLERLAAIEPAGGDRIEIDRYRALCLFALGRADDAAAAIDAMVARDPFRRASSEVPPRMQSVIVAARQRLLPDMIERTYADAKAAFDRRAFEEARAGFARVLDALADPDLAPLSEQAPLADLKTLAEGFRQLAAAAIPPPPPPAPAAPEPQGPDLRVYSVEDADVVVPQAISQELPRYPGPLRTARTGVIEVIISAAGEVESAVMTVSVDPVYDRRVLSAARTWRYRPASRQGTPVRFVRRIQVTLAPPD